MSADGSRGLAMAAEMTWLRHQVQADSTTPGRCKRCTDDGCPLLAWAVAVRVGQPARYPAMGEPTPVSLRALDGQASAESASKAA